MFKKTAFQFLFVVAALGMTTWCYAGDGNIDACKLISAADASRILGVKLKVKKVGNSDISSMCNYSGGGLHGGFMLIAARLHYKSAKQEVTRQEKAVGSSTPPGLPKPHVEPVSGLGEGAFIYEMGGTFQLHVLSHGASIVIGRNTPRNPTTLSQAEKLARLALKKL